MGIDALAIEATVSGIVGVFMVMVFLQIMVHVGSSFAKAVERRQAAAAARAAEKKEREARRKQRMAAK